MKALKITPLPRRPINDASEDPADWSPCKQHSLGVRYTHDYSTRLDEAGERRPVCPICGDPLEL